MLKYLISKDWKFYFEWTSTFILLVGVILTSLNIFPMNVYFLLIGNIGWIILGFLWKKISLIILQSIITIIYILGIIKTII